MGGDVAHAGPEFLGEGTGFAVGVVELQEGGGGFGEILSELAGPHGKGFSPTFLGGREMLPGGIVRGRNVEHGDLLLREEHLVEENQRENVQTDC